MTTTLIVRDATLAINGAPEQRGQPREHLVKRIAEVVRLDARTAEECVEVLSSVAGGDSADPDVLEALMVVGLAQPELAERLNLPTLATGRRLAARLEREGDIERTQAVLETLKEHMPGQEAIERDLAQLMRRQDTVQDLVGRYFQRAHKLVREGRTSEAAGWLREVLQLDPGRKDAARMLRNLRFKSAGRAQRKSGGFRWLLLFALASLGLSYAGLREVRLREEFRSLPALAGHDLPGMKRRLADLERFAAQHPVWHGAFALVAERTELRVQIAVLEDEARQHQEAAERAQRERLESAELCRQRGLMEAQSGDLQGALGSLREALEFGGPQWAEFERTSRDVSDLEALMKGRQ